MTIRRRLPIFAGAMTEAYINSAASWVIDRSHRLAFLPFHGSHSLILDFCLPCLH